MLKRTLEFVSYLLVSLAVGMLVILLSTNLATIVEEKKVKQETEQTVQKAVVAFHKSAPGADPEQTAEFVRRFVAAAMEGKLIAVDRDPARKPDKKAYDYLFTFSEGRNPIDLYISKSYVVDEAYGPDIPQFIEGFFATVLAFTAIIMYAEKRRQTSALKREFATQHAEMEKALEEHQALALLGRMTATLAHELKTPLATISNLIYVLPSRLSEERFTRRFDVLVKDELNRVQQLIDNLLIYGKEITLNENRWIDLTDFVRQLSARIHLKISSCPPLSVYGDGFYLSLLFENLMRNSLQAEAREASLRATPFSPSDNSFAEITFEDDGAGFPPQADMAELISPFVTHRSKGAGLGLYLARKIAVAHGGTLAIYRPSKGAGVKIFLPRERIRFNGR